MMLSFALSKAQSPILQNLYQCMQKKKTRLAVSVDLTDPDACLSCIDAVGPHVCMIKTHIDILHCFNSDFIKALLNLKRKHNFIILEDRKFADIGHTSVLQYTASIYRIIEWADLVTVHALPGPGLLQALSDAADCFDLPRGALLLAQMSAEGNFFDAAYTKNALLMAGRYPKFILGLIAQQCLSPKLATFSPGVHVNQTGDQQGQQYRTPRQAIERDGADVVIVGRGIINSDNQSKTAAIYQSRTWFDLN